MRQPSTRSVERCWALITAILRVSDGRPESTSTFTRSGGGISRAPAVGFPVPGVETFVDSRQWRGQSNAFATEVLVEPFALDGERICVEAISFRCRTGPSHAARYVTRVVLPVDGGCSIT